MVKISNIKVQHLNKLLRDIANEKVKVLKKKSSHQILNVEIIVSGQFFRVGQIWFLSRDKYDFYRGKNMISLTKKRIFCNCTIGSCGSFTFPSPFKKLPLTQFESKEWQCFESKTFCVTPPLEELIDPLLNSVKLAFA